MFSIRYRLQGEKRRERERKGRKREKAHKRERKDAARTVSVKHTGRKNMLAAHRETNTGKHRNKYNASTLTCTCRKIQDNNRGKCTHMGLHVQVDAHSGR